MKTGIELIAQERKEQIEKHGWTSAHDLGHNMADLKDAALFCLTLNTNHYPVDWDNWFKEKVADKEMRLSREEFEIEMLKIAGAFCAAEIDRLLRMKVIRSNSTINTPQP